jgi:DNA-binding protein WhiA
LSFAQKVREEILCLPLKCKSCIKARELAINIFCENISTSNIISQIEQKECCVSAFVQGAFLACGSITNPSNDYHLEFKVKSEKTAQALWNLFEKIGFEFRKIIRNNDNILYIKDSEKIEDILTFMGAVKSSLEIMDIKILKDVRNNINRTTNCETANITRTVDASTVQISAINKIISKKGFDYIPDELQEIAQKRIENPEISLRELKDLLSVNLSKSGVNHRLKKLIEISNELN